MVHFKKTGRDYSWIIIASAYAPDLDSIANVVFSKLGIPFLFDGHAIRHGDFHNMAILLLYAIGVALVLQVIRYRYLDAFVFAGIGFGAHILEDALVYKISYPFFWPLSDQPLSMGLIEYSRDIYNIADPRVLFIGLIAIILFGYIRVVNDGMEWVYRYMKIIFAMLILALPVLH